MITKERIEELKSLYQKEVIYYGNLDFTVLQGKFQEFVNFLNEIEEIIKENEDLKARVQAYEDEARIKMAAARAASDGEVCD